MSVTHSRVLAGVLNAVHFSVPMPAGPTLSAVAAAPPAAPLAFSDLDPLIAKNIDGARFEAYTATLSNSEWVGELNRVRDSVDSETKLEQKLVASSVAITGSLSVGYVMWLLRGGLLLSSLLSSLPAWHVIDPMPVLSHTDGGRKDDKPDDDPLEKLFSKARAAVGLSRSAPSAAAAAKAANGERSASETLQTNT
jgi:hypothetical protein